MRAFLSVTCILLAGSVTAAPVTWTLDGIEYLNGGTLSGSFDYDAETEIYSNINIVSSGETGLSGAHYQVEGDADLINTNASRMQLQTYDIVETSPFTSFNGLLLDWDGTLSSAGGTYAVSVWERTCTHTCGDYSRNLDLSGPGPGYVGTITAVPLPAALLFFSSALGGLFAFRKRQ